MKKTDNTVTILMVTLGIIIAGIILTTIIRATKGTTETRTRAASASTLELTGTVASQSDTEYSLTVEGLHFEDNRDTDLGLWKIIPPTSYEPSKFPPGTRVNLSADPKSFSIPEKTLRAVKISKR